jgi:hypothetical protein
MRDFVDANRLEQWLAGWDYRPGVSLSLHTDVNGRVASMLTVRMRVPDVYNPSVVSTVLHTTPVSPWAIHGRYDFARLVQQSVHAAEMHEADEWLRDRTTGTPLFNPHLPNNEQHAYQQYL